MSEAVLSEVIGYCAAASTCATLVPQIHKVYMTRSATDLSFTMIALNLTSDVLWTAYGIMNTKTPLIVTGFITAVTAFTLAALKFALHEPNVPSLHMHENPTSSDAISQA